MVEMVHTKAMALQRFDFLRLLQGFQKYCYSQIYSFCFGLWPWLGMKPLLPVPFIGTKMVQEVILDCREPLIEIFSMWKVLYSVANRDLPSSAIRSS